MSPIDRTAIDCANERFWSQFLDRLKAKGIEIPFETVPDRSSMLRVELSVPGLFFVFIKQMDSIIGEIRMAGGMKSEIWLNLLRNEVAIEEVSGLDLHSCVGSFCWMYFRICRRYRAIDEHNWEAVHEKMIDCMTRFLVALQPYLEA